METKPGWQTSSFWLTMVAQVIGTILETMAMPMLEKSPSPWAAMLLVLCGALIQVAALYGYQRQRATVEVTRLEGVAKSEAPSPSR